jgi:hypothetical protein
MMRDRFFFICLLLLILNGCGSKEETNSMTMHIKLLYDGKPLTMFDKYTYPDGTGIYFSKFTMFMGDIHLTNESAKTLISDITFHDLTNSHSGTNHEYTYKFNDIAEGKYTGFHFSLGVPKQLNDKTPAAFDSKNVLSNQSEYWSNWKSYVFTKTEGYADLAKDGKYSQGFALHTGANDALRTIENNINLDFKNGTERHIYMDIDLKKQFGTDKIYDLKKNAQIHSLSQQPQVIELIDNLAGAISVRS